MRSQILVTGLLALLIFVASVFGQSTSGLISGTIEDASSALIPGVTVTATNVNTGVVATAVSNETGAYSFPSLTPGEYKVTAELPSFQTETRTNVQLGNAQQLRLNFSLKVGAAQQAIEVSVPIDALLATVYYGDQTWEEMHFPSYGLVLSDPNIDPRRVIRGPGLGPR